jgi:hypothetical protein
MPYLVAEHSEFVLLRGGSIGSCAFRHGNGRIQMMMVPIRHDVGVALAFFLDAQFQSGYLMAQYVDFGVFELDEVRIDWF